MALHLKLKCLLHERLLIKVHGWLVPYSQLSSTFDVCYRRGQDRAANHVGEVSLIPICLLQRGSTVLLLSPRQTGKHTHLTLWVTLQRKAKTHLPLVQLPMSTCRHWRIQILLKCTKNMLTPQSFGPGLQITAAAGKHVLGCIFRLQLYSQRATILLNVAQHAYVLHYWKEPDTLKRKFQKRELENHRIQNGFRRPSNALKNAATWGTSSHHKLKCNTLVVKWQDLEAHIGTTDHMQFPTSAWFLPEWSHFTHLYVTSRNSLVLSTRTIDSKGSFMVSDGIDVSYYGAGLWAERNASLSIYTSFWSICEKM